MKRLQETILCIAASHAFRGTKRLIGELNVAAKHNKQGHQLEDVVTSMSIV
jgi:hypothetical protein